MWHQDLTDRSYIQWTVATRHCVYSGQSNFEFKEISEYETEFEHILGYVSGAQVSSIERKKQR
jgi:hypothetical protein